uniref:guanylate cyclase n=1 Tax=Acrobeloides nanus TaxID=290746 RepID=A0A914C6E2_9BILA
MGGIPLHPLDSSSTMNTSSTEDTSSTGQFTHHEQFTHHGQASSNAPLLADAFYLYANALNKTLTQNGTWNISNGSLLSSHMKGVYNGYSGLMVIDESGTRQPIFYIYGLDSNHVQQPYVIISMQGNSTSWQPQYTDRNASTTIWANFGGQKPLSTPTCGFDGSGCPVPFFFANLLYFIIGIIAVLLLIIGILLTAFYIYRLRRREEDRLDSQWQIPFVTLVKPKEKMRQIDHENLNRFVGLSFDGPMFLSVWKFCSRGSLKDIIEKGNLNLDAFFMTTIIRDICEGLSYIHNSPVLQQHGYLTSESCLVDERWQVKLNYYGLKKVHLIRDCWAENEDERPKIETVKSLLKAMQGGK